VVCFVRIASFTAQCAANAFRLEGDQIAQGVGALLGSADLVALAYTPNQNG